MKAKEIEVGGVYLAKVSGRLVPVRVERVREVVQGLLGRGRERTVGRREREHRPANRGQVAPAVPREDGRLRHGFRACPIRYAIEEVAYHGYVLVLGDDLVWRALKDGQVVAEGHRHEVDAYVQMAILAAYLAGGRSSDSASDPDPRGPYSDRSR